MMKKTTADSKSKVKNTRYTRYLHGQQLPGKGWSYFVTKLAYCSLAAIQVLDGSYIGNIFKLAMVNTVPCMFTGTHSLGQRVDDWII